MGTWRRMAVLTVVTIAIAAVGIIYYRVGVAHLFPLATQTHAGPYSHVVDLLDWIVPVTLAIIELATILWAIGAGVKEERARVRRGI